jgi:hypothetical protein
MPTKVHYWLAFSNIIAIYPFICHTKQYGLFSFGNLLILLAGLSSVLMHMSETKHNLEPGPVWRKWSQYFLNLDRVSAVSASIYFTLLWQQNNYPIISVLLLIKGLIASGIGEMTNNQIIYLICHTIWHIDAYVGMANTM